MATYDVLLANVLAVLRQDAARAVLTVVDNIRADAPFDSGDLEESIQVESTGDLTWRVFSDLDYAGMQDSGSEGFEIRPVNKKALFWDGALFPVAKVNHPGYSRNTGWWTDWPWEEELERALQTELTR